MPEERKFSSRSLFSDRFVVKPPEAAIPELIDWFATPVGEQLLLDEQGALDEALHCLFGYFLLELSIDPAFDVGASSRISNRFSLHPLRGQQSGPSAQADFHHLPLSDKTVDVAILHHVLDFSATPHQLLREAARLIIPRGHLIVVGFNPGGFTGIARWFMRFFSRRAIWQRQSLRLGRVIDWLKLLDFEPVSVTTGFFRPPINSVRVLKHLHWLEAWGKKLRLPLGGYYLIVARKDIAGVTPLLKPAWKPYQGGVTSGLGVTRIVDRCQSATAHRGVRRKLYD